MGKTAKITRIEFECIACGKKIRLHSTEGLDLGIPCSKCGTKLRFNVWKKEEL